MLDGFSRLTYVDVIYAALAAFVITQVVLSFSRLKRNMARMRVQPGANREAERLAIIKQCRSMFPVGTVNFRGKVFTTGMRVRIIYVVNPLILLPTNSRFMFVVMYCNIHSLKR